MFGCPESRPTITKKTETNAITYAGIVPCTEGIRRSDVSGMKTHQSGINQLGRPFIERNKALSLLLLRQGKFFPSSKLRHRQWATQTPPPDRTDKSFYPSQQKIAGMKIPLWIPEESQTAHGTKNEKGKGEMKEPDDCFVAYIIAGRLSRIARYPGSFMPDDDRRIGVCAGALA
jgi:hypothetical protein